MEYVLSKESDGYIADTNLRRCDPRFVAYDRFNDRYRRELYKSRGGRKLFAPADFVFADDFSSCLPCRFRRECLRYPERTETRHVAYLTNKNANGQSNALLTG